MLKVPISVVVYARPTRANGMSFWAFDLTALGLVALAIDYTIFLDWFTPPGAEDPLPRCRRSDR
ncbi:hypothetical protein NKY70_29865 [Sinorhizobium meliloti]|nr:hypothetical protein [Sinorhizobium meliloti]AEG57341.1 hypothetical protein Sinme_5807 [Sinorhizobium meliloti AK83]SEJ64234.1 hypothetical protein SAMN04244575_05457 [Sinorhizobium meliloti]